MPTWTQHTCNWKTPTQKIKPTNDEEENSSNKRCQKCARYQKTPTDYTDLVKIWQFNEDGT